MIKERKIPRTFVIRHGVSVANVQQYNDVDAPLHDHGKDQIRQSARFLVDHVKDKHVIFVYSPLQRARDTTMIMLNELVPHTASVKLIRSEMCREQRNVISDLLHHGEQLGETEDELERRCEIFRKQLSNPQIQSKDVIIVVSHGMFLWKLLGKRMMPQNAQLIEIK